MNTTYFNNLILNHTFGVSQTPNVLPTSYWIGLSSTTPTVAGGNTTEPNTAAGYSRVKISGALSGATGGVLKNSGVVEFSESTGAWGVVTHVCVWDAKEGGTLLAFEALSPSRTIEEKSTLMFKAGQLSISLK